MNRTVTITGGRGDTRLAYSTTGRSPSQGAAGIRGSPTAQPDGHHHRGLRGYATRLQHNRTVTITGGCGDTRLAYSTTGRSPSQGAAGIRDSPTAQPDGHHHRGLRGYAARLQHNRTVTITGGCGDTRLAYSTTGRSPSQGAAGIRGSPTAQPDGHHHRGLRGYATRLQHNRTVTITGGCGDTRLAYSTTGRSPSQGAAGIRGSPTAQPDGHHHRGLRGYATRLQHNRTVTITGGCGDTRLAYSTTGRSPSQGAAGIRGSPTAQPDGHHHRGLRGYAARLQHNRTVTITGGCGDTRLAYSTTGRSPSQGAAGIRGSPTAQPDGHHHRGLRGYAARLQHNRTVTITGGCGDTRLAYSTTGRSPSPGAAGIRDSPTAQPDGHHHRGLRGYAARLQHNRTVTITGGCGDTRLAYSTTGRSPSQGAAGIRGSPTAQPDGHHHRGLRGYAARLQHNRTVTITGGCGDTRLAYSTTGRSPSQGAAGIRGSPTAQPDGHHHRGLRGYAARLQHNRTVTITGGCGDTRLAYSTTGRSPSQGAAGIRDSPTAQPDGHHHRGLRGYAARLQHNRTVTITGGCGDTRLAYSTTGRSPSQGAAGIRGSPTAQPDGHHHRGLRGYAARLQHNRTVTITGGCGDTQLAYSTTGRSPSPGAAGIRGSPTAQPDGHHHRGLRGYAARLQHNRTVTITGGCGDTRLAYSTTGRSPSQGAAGIRGSPAAQPDGHHHRGLRGYAARLQHNRTVTITGGCGDTRLAYSTTGRSPSQGAAGIRDSPTAQPDGHHHRGLRGYAARLQHNRTVTITGGCGDTRLAYSTTGRSPSQGAAGIRGSPTAQPDGHHHRGLRGYAARLQHNRTVTITGGCGDTRLAYSTTGRSPSQGAAGIRGSPTAQPDGHHHRGLRGYAARLQHNRTVTITGGCGDTRLAYSTTGRSPSQGAAGIRGSPTAQPDGHHHRGLRGYAARLQHNRTVTITGGCGDTRLAYSTTGRSPSQGAAGIRGSPTAQPDGHHHRGLRGYAARLQHNRTVTITGGCGDTRLAYSTTGRSPSPGAAGIRGSPTAQPDGHHHRGLRGYAARLQHNRTVTITGGCGDTRLAYSTTGRSPSQGAAGIRDSPTAQPDGHHHRGLRGYAARLQHNRTVTITGGCGDTRLAYSTTGRSPSQGAAGIRDSPTAQPDGHHHRGLRGYATRLQHNRTVTITGGCGDTRLAYSTTGRSPSQGAAGIRDSPTAQPDGHHHRGLRGYATRLQHNRTVTITGGCGDTRLAYSTTGRSPSQGAAGIRGSPTAQPDGHHHRGLRGYAARLQHNRTVTITGGCGDTRLAYSTTSNTLIPLKGYG